jgi:DNA-binding MarR family transcriptional regulator
VKNIIQNLDKAFDNKIRLGIMSVLLVNTKATFNHLKEMLEKAEYIAVTKTFTDRKPNTSYEITEAGKAAFDRHLQALEDILKQL